MKSSRFLFWIIACLALVCIIIGSRSDAQTTISGSQMRAGFLQPYHLGDSLDWVYTIRVNDSTVAYAATALTMKNGVLTTGAFVSTSLDSLRRFLIQNSDTSDVTKSLLAGAVDDSTKLGDDFKTLLTGRNIALLPFIYKAQRASLADLATLAENANTATYADSCGAAPTQTNANFADSAAVAAVAWLAVNTMNISTDTTVGTGSVEWVSLSEAVQDSIQADTIGVAVRAFYADSLSAGAFDSYGMFSTDMKSGYIPTANEKAAMAQGTLGGVPSGTNKFLDSLAFRYRGVLKATAAMSGWNLRIAVGAARADSAWKIAIDTSDASGAKLTFVDGSGSVSVFLDSTDTRALLSGSYVATGAGGTPQYIWITSTSEDPGSPEDGDIWVDTTANRVYVYEASVWVEIGGGGGGGTGDSSRVWTNEEGWIDADSLTVETRAQIISQPWKFNEGIATDSSNASIGYPGTSFENMRAQTMHMDFLESAANDYVYAMRDIRGYPGQPHNIGDSDSTMRFVFYGDSLFLKNSGMFYHRNTSSRPDCVNVILPVRVADASKLGTIGNPYDSVNAGTVQADKLVGSSSIYGYSIAPSAVSYKYGSHRWDGSSLYLDGTAKMICGENSEIGFPNWSMDANGLVDMPTDTMFYCKTTNYGWGWYGLLDPNERRAMDSACSPTGTNPLITEHDIQTAPSIEEVPWDSARAFSDHLTDITHFDWVQDIDPYIETKDVCLRSSEPGIPHIAEFKWQSTDISGGGVTRRILPDVSMWFTNAPDFGDPPDTTWPPTVVDPQSPILHGEYVVSQEYNDALGPYTGYFQTIQAALDSIPNLRAVVVSSGRVTQTNPDTITIAPLKDDSVRLSFYRGDRELDTLADVPDQYQSQGMYVQRAHLSTDGSGIDLSWTPIARWINDSTFTINDTLLTNAVINDCTIIIAKPWLVTINPSQQGVVWQENGIKINSFCPVSIRGLGERATTLTNYSDDDEYWGNATADERIFYCDTSSVESRSRYNGMSIVLSDMTLYSTKGSGAGNEALLLSGRIRLENLTIRGGWSSASAQGIFVRGGTKISQHSVVLKNVTMVIDSNATAIRTNGYMSFESCNSHYGVGGATGYILYCQSDLYSTPQFVGDEFYHIGATCSTFCSASGQTSDSLSIVQCRSVGFDLTSAATYGGTNFVTMMQNGSNVYQGGQSEPPVFFREAQFLLHPGGYPK